MITAYILCSILMHFVSGLTIAYLYMVLSRAVKFAEEKEERIMELNKENARLQEACRTPKAKAKLRRLRRKD